MSSYSFLVKEKPNIEQMKSYLEILAGKKKERRSGRKTVGERKYVRNNRKRTE